MTDKDEGKRLDCVVVEHLKECSRNVIAKLIRKGLLLVDNKIKKPGYKVKAGEKLRGVVLKPAPIPSCYPEPLPLDIIFQDTHLVVINKQPGIVVHQSPGHYCGTLVNAVLYHCPDIKGVGDALRPGIVHRLDKDTSGIMVIAKTHNTHVALSSLFKSRDIKKQYVAIVSGNIKKNTGKITSPIGRHPVDRKKMSINSKHPKSAETSWSVNKRFGFATLLDIAIKTGRTHQIRVHFASIHHHIVGDSLYGNSKFQYLYNCSGSIQKNYKAVTRQMLHAQRLCFNHPISGEFLDFTASIPKDMDNLIKIAINQKKNSFP